jgi:ribose transport system substrate-binding protein
LQETSFEQQVSIVEDLVQNKRADALVIAPANAHHLIPAVRKARDAGIPVVIIDARLDATQLAVADLAGLPFISVDNEKGAYLAVKALSAGIEVPTTAAILEGIRSAENAQARKQGAERAFSENTAIRVVASETANWKIDEAYEVTRKMFELHPGIGLLFAANDMMALGALRYLSDNGLSSVKVAGFDALPEIRTMVDQGKLAVTVDQRSAEQGYQGVLYAIRLLKGEKVPSETLIDVELVSAPK